MSNRIVGELLPNYVHGTAFPPIVLSIVAGVRISSLIYNLMGKQEVLGRTNRLLSFYTTRRTLTTKKLGGAESHRQQRDLINLLSFFSNMESRLKN
jgi:hypothetical protein